MSTAQNMNPPAPSVEPVRMAGAGRRATLAFIAKYGTIIGMLLMILAFSIAAPDKFPTRANFINILNQAALTAIISGGLTVVLIIGEMDLSIGYAGSLAGVLVTGLMVKQGLPVWLAIVVVLAIGALIGSINGLVVTKFKVTSVIATLGIGTMLIGATFAYSTGVPIASGIPKVFTAITLSRALFNIPNNIFYMLAVLLLLGLVVNRTDLGQQIQAVGGSIEAARLSGIRVDRVKIIAYVMSGLCAALTGILLASWIGSGTASAADSYLLTAFAATYLGSATLRDGEFHILGTFIGVLIIGIGLNGIAILGFPTFYQYVFQGFILVLAVGLSSVARQLAKN